MRGWDEPPEGLWISPEDQSHQVTEHLLFLKRNPDLFDLDPRRVEGSDLDVLQRVGVEVIRKGWIRFRYLSGRFCFEAPKVDERLERWIDRIILRWNASDGDQISISEASPPGELRVTVEEFRKGLHRKQTTRILTDDWRFSGWSGVRKKS